MTLAIQANGLMRQSSRGQMRGAPVEVAMGDPDSSLVIDDISWD